MILQTTQTMIYFFSSENIQKVYYLLQTFLQTTNGIDTIYHFYNSELLKASIKQSEAHKCLAPALI